MKNRKVVIVGAGFVGTSLAYSLINQNSIGINEIVLIDLNEKKTIGEVMDLSHGISFINSSIGINYGDYSDCKDADVVVITAGASNVSHIEDRLEFAKANTKIVKEITENVVNSGFKGIFIVATNPVDLMCYVIKKVSNFPSSKVIGTGTLLDTVRFQCLLGEYFNVLASNILCPVLGEHGNSSFPVLSHTFVGSRTILEVLSNNEGKWMEIEKLFKEAQEAGNEVANRKGNTSFAIGMTINRILKSIFLDERAELPISIYLENEYGVSDICMSVPVIVGKNGIEKIIPISFNKNEKEAFLNSYHILNRVKEKDVLPILVD
ncbi:MAG: L-lactate dehydrogenase [Clostridia bacterium]|nr:L-lactate dehydrogenase [Clostridia bacterium]